MKTYTFSTFDDTKLDAAESDSFYESFKSIASSEEKVCISLGDGSCTLSFKPSEVFGDNKFDNIGERMMYLIGYCFKESRDDLNIYPDEFDNPANETIDVRLVAIYFKAVFPKVGVVQMTRKRFLEIRKCSDELEQTAMVCQELGISSMEGLVKKVMVF